MDSTKESGVFQGCGILKAGGPINQTSLDNLRGLEGLDPFFCFDNMGIFLYVGMVYVSKTRVYVN